MPARDSVEEKANLASVDKWLLVDGKVVSTSGPQSREEACRIINAAFEARIKIEKVKAFSDGMLRSDEIWINRDGHHTDCYTSQKVLREADRYRNGEDKI